jgi:hypothetical protein
MHIPVDVLVDVEVLVDVAVDVDVEVVALVALDEVALAEDEAPPLPPPPVAAAEVVSLSPQLAAMASAREAKRAGIQARARMMEWPR